MDKPSEEVSTEPVWSSDVLDRAQFAEFLTNYLVRRVAGSTSTAGTFTLALDAGWGQGKTFFVQNWSRALSEARPRHPTFVFDAWAADYAADPIVAFMAALKAALEAEIARLPKKEQAARALNDAWKAARRAVWPATKVAAKGVLKKLTGVGADELLEAVVAEDSEFEPNVEALAEGGLSAFNDSLDEFFKKALEGYSDRSKSIKSFRSLIEETLRQLAEHGEIQLPMFIFIDELDRCRPSFAVSLLEGVKHLFGVQGACFVVSTNLNQLAESVKSIYGVGFDGYGYLKRFFDVQVSLPVAKGPAFADLALAPATQFFDPPTVIGLPFHGFVGEPGTASTIFEWASEAFDLNLRAQRQVVETFIAAASGLPKSWRLHFIWMLGLCAVRHKNSALFEALAARTELNAAEFDKLIKTIAPTSSRRTYLDVSAEPEQKRQIEFLDVFSLYYQTAHKQLRTIKKEASRGNIYAYPASLRDEVAKEHHQDEKGAQVTWPSLTFYFDLVRNAGHIRQTA